MRCPIDNNLTPSKRNCKGCEYFDFDESDGGDEGRIYRPICTYKKEDDKD